VAIQDRIRPGGKVHHGTGKGIGRKNMIEMSKEEYPGESSGDYHAPRAILGRAGVHYPAAL
jgi:hypothetical protein